MQGGCEEIIDGITEPSMEHFVQMHDDVLRLRRLVDDLGALATPTLRSPDRTSPSNVATSRRSPPTEPMRSARSPTRTNSN